MDESIKIYIPTLQRPRILYIPLTSFLLKAVNYDKDASVKVYLFSTCKSIFTNNIFHEIDLTIKITNNEDNKFIIETNNECIQNKRYTENSNKTKTTTRNNNLEANTENKRYTEINKIKKTTSTNSNSVANTENNKIINTNTEINKIPNTGINKIKNTTTTTNTNNQNNKIPNTENNKIPNDDEVINIVIQFINTRLQCKDPFCITITHHKLHILPQTTTTLHTAIKSTPTTATHPTPISSFSTSSPPPTTNTTYSTTHLQTTKSTLSFATSPISLNSYQP